MPGKSRGQRSLAGYSPRGYKGIGHDLVTKQPTKAILLRGTESGVHACAPTGSLALVPTQDALEEQTTSWHPCARFHLLHSFLCLPSRYIEHQLLHGSQSTPHARSSLLWVPDSPGCPTAAHAVGTPPRPLALAGGPSSRFQGAGCHCSQPRLLQQWALAGGGRAALLLHGD